MTTTDKITVIFGITIDSLALLTVLIYMPLVNWWERKQEKIKITKTISSDFDEFYN